MAAVTIYSDFGAQENKVCHSFHCFPIYLPWTQSCPTLCYPMDYGPPGSMRFSRQEYWNGLPFPPSGDLPNPGIERESPASPALVGGFFTAESPGKLSDILDQQKYSRVWTEEIVGQVKWTTTNHTKGWSSFKEGDVVYMMGLEGSLLLWVPSRKPNY